MTYYGRWTYKFEEAARQGAAAAMIVHDTFPAAYGWNVVNSSWTGAQYYVAVAPTTRWTRPLANGWVQKPVADAILKAAGKDLRDAFRSGGAARASSAVPLGLKASLSLRQHDPQGRTRTTSSACCRARRGPTNTCSTPRTGITSAAAPPTRPATTSATARSTMRPASRAIDRAGRGHARQGRARRAQPGVPGGDAGGIGPARLPNITPRTRCFRSTQTVGGVNMDALAAGGPRTDVTLTGGDKSELTDHSRTRAGRAWA